ncbi:MAG TPA: serine hydrolase [Gemmatimonadaceae bacterium]|nr:serine hydrolase [Gemmatimonadaceae bacterium]
MPAVALSIAIVAISIPCSAVAAQASGEWAQYANAADAGFSVAELDDARKYADSVRSAAVMVVHRGRVVVAWGDVNRKFGLHSVRKSLVSGLYGTAVADGKIDLDATLGKLGITDRQPLTDAEKSAKVRHLLLARSGVFLPAAYAPADQDAERPARGTHPPGAHWFYNNWDFNVAGVIYERLTGENLYESFLRRIARPIGMQDYAVSDGLIVLEPSLSSHPAHTFRMSTRDLARFGQLYLQKGKWNGRQIIPEKWIAESTTSPADVVPGQGYAYMWWTYSVGGARSNYPLLKQRAFYQARGTGGQIMFVIPDQELVIVLRGDTDNNRNVGGNATWTIAERILAAKKSEPVAQPRLVALSPVVFQSQVPAPAEPQIISLRREDLEKYVGEYTIGPNAIARVTIHEEKLFMFFPGQGEGQLYATSPNEFTVRVVSGVKVTFDRDAQGASTGVTVKLGNQTMKGPKTK